jgi:isorenieratene synthase
VIGGGIAGLAAATGLAERGVAVTVLEREPQLGGRVSSWAHTLPDGTVTSMGRGFHAFFRQYYNLRALLRRTDPELEQLVAVPDYPVVDSEGRRDSFRGLPRTPPWNALAFALRSPSFRVSDLLRLDPVAAAPLADVSLPHTYQTLDDTDAESFLRRINFPPAARHLAFEVFSRSFFAPPEDLSAAELATMFHLYFLGSSEGLLFDVPRASFAAALWSPLRRYLTGLGAQICTGEQATAISAGGHGWRVHTRSGVVLDGNGIVLAADVAGLRQLVAGSPDLTDAAWRSRVERLLCAPPFLVLRLWLDRPVARHRPAFLGTAGLPPLDNVTVLDRYEQEARAWAHRHGGSVLELHAYAATAPSPQTCHQLTERLHQLYPETATATVLGSATLRREDCPLFALGSFADRPGVATPFPGLTLAGDGIRIDLPTALMERAATTGWHAANLLLADWGLAGHPIHTVPTSGRLALLRRLARRTEAAAC